jgi:alcohol dehydrogenase class IV
MRFNLPERVDEFAEMGRILGVATADQEPLEQAHQAILRIEALLQIAGAPLNLKAIGLEPEHFEQIAKQSMLATRLLANNPRPLSHQAVLGILAKGHADDRSWWELPTEA